MLLAVAKSISHTNSKFAFVHTLSLRSVDVVLFTILKEFRRCNGIFNIFWWNTCADNELTHPLLITFNPAPTAADNKHKHNLLWWRYQFHEKWPEYQRDLATLFLIIIILLFYCEWIRFKALSLYDFQFIILRRLLWRTTQNTNNHISRLRCSLTL